MLYAMAKTLRELDAKVAACDGWPSLDDLAATLTDLHGAEYDGPVPVDGEPVRGLVRAYTPSQSTILAKKAAISVWVQAVTVDATTDERAMP